MRVRDLLHSLSPTGTTATPTSCAASRASCWRAATTCACTSRATAGASRTSSREHGQAPLDEFAARVSGCAATRYDRRRSTSTRALDGADLVLVHEWNEHALVARDRRASRAHRRAIALLFHDTHHRSVTDPARWRRYDLPHYDGVLAFGDVHARPVPRARAGRSARVDVARGRRHARLPPAPDAEREAATWSGSATGATTSAPRSCTSSCSSRSRRSACARASTACAIREHALARAARRRASTTAAGCRTIDVPRGVRALPRDRARAAPAVRRARCPASRRFACSRRWPAASRWSRAPWDDAEGLFTPGERLSGRAQRRRDAARTCERAVATIASCALQLARARPARRSWRRHTCAHRVDELLAIVAELAPQSSHDDGARAWKRSTRHRVLRLEPRLGLLERRRHVLPRHRPRAARARPPRHVLRARRLRAPAAPRHRRPDLGDGRRLPGASEPTACARGARARPRRRRRSSRRAASACSTSCSSGGAGAAAPGSAARVFWDVDAPATLDRVEQRPRRSVPRADPALRPGPHLRRRRARRARLQRVSARAQCVPIYNALDPHTHHPVPPDPRFDADLAFLGNRLPDREARVDEFFLARRGALARAARSCSAATAGTTRPMPPNVRYVGHVYTRDHNALQLHAARRAERQPRQHGALRLLAGDARVRGRRRRRVPHHRRVGGHRAVPRAGRARSSSRATATRSPSTSRRSTPSARARIGEAAQRARAGASTRTRTARAAASTHAARRAHAARHGVSGRM